MEQNTAILMADLSGYTALTETHGSSTAADIIEKFLEIVNDSLAGNSKLHQCVGDEVLIISNDPENLMSTAVVLLQKCSQQNNFLQVHGGLHYGKLLMRNNNYFGSSLNLTSRIAAKANKGSLWCSDTFVNVLPKTINFNFRSMGMHDFKNVREQNEIFELVIEDAKAFQIDPVCRMLIHKKETAVPHPEKDILFCSAACRDIYISKFTSNQSV